MYTQKPINVNRYIATEIGSALIGGASSLLGSLFGHNSNKANNKLTAQENQKNRDFSHDEAELAYQRQRTLIQEERDYNSFANQRKLMQEAGYNPNMFVGGNAGTAVATNSTNAPQASTPSTLSYSNAGDLMAAQNIANIGQSMANIRLINSQAKEHEQKTEESEAYTSQMQIQNVILKATGMRKEIAGINQTEALTALQDNQSAVQETLKKLNEFDLNFLKPNQVASIKSQIFLNNSQGILNQAIRAKTDQELNYNARLFGLRLALFQAQITNYYAQSNASNSVSNLNRATIGLVNSERDLNFNRTSLAAQEIRRNNAYFTPAVLEFSNEVFLRELQVKNRMLGRRLFGPKWMQNMWQGYDEAKDVIGLGLNLSMPLIRR